jgi:hypothetical protein
MRGLRNLRMLPAITAGCVVCLFSPNQLRAENASVVIVNKTGWGGGSYILELPVSKARAMPHWDWQGTKAPPVALDRAFALARQEMEERRSGYSYRIFSATLEKVGSPGFQNVWFYEFRVVYLQPEREKKVPRTGWRKGPYGESGGCIVVLPDESVLSTFRLKPIREDS